MSDMSGWRRGSDDGVKWLIRELRRALRIRIDSDEAHTALLARARALLKRVEWSTEGYTEGQCPECAGQERPSFDGRMAGGHKPGCELAALLKEEAEAAHAA